MRARGVTGTGEETPAASAEVLLRLPGEPAFLRVARVTASGLASRMGFSIDEVDDLRLAVDELCRPLVVTDQTTPDNGATSRAPTLVVRLRSTPAALEVEAWSEGPASSEGSEGRAADPGEGTAFEPDGKTVSGTRAELSAPETVARPFGDPGTHPHQPARHPPAPSGSGASPRHAGLGGGRGTGDDTTPGEETAPGPGGGSSAFDGLGQAILRVLVDDFGALEDGRHGGGRDSAAPNGLWFVKARGI
jgi:serine/threonine-protein kinase RsbW